MAPAVRPTLELSPRERREYRLSSAILAAAYERRSGLAFEIDQQLRKDWGAPDPATEGSFYVPRDIPLGTSERAGLYVGSATVGGDLEYPVVRPWIDILRVQTVLGRAGARFITGLKGNATFPRISTAETVYSVAENPGSDTTEADIALQTFTIAPYTLQAVTAYSRQLLAQSAQTPENSIDRVVATSLARQHAVQVDTLGLGGTGASHQPTGVATQLASGQLIVLAADAGNGGVPVWQDLAAIEGAVANANAAFPEFEEPTTDTAVPRSTWIMAPTMRQQLRVTDKGASTSTTTGRFVIEECCLMGHPVMVTNAIPQALTKGSSSVAQAIVFGVFQDLYVGFFGPGFELVVDPFTLKKQGMIGVASYELFGVGVAHTGSFAGTLGALT